jgi:hypothetical protein
MLAFNSESLSKIIIEFDGVLSSLFNLLFSWQPLQCSKIFLIYQIGVFNMVVEYYFFEEAS